MRNVQILSVALKASYVKPLNGIVYFIDFIITNHKLSQEFNFSSL
jgi:hypothetical protein